MAALGSCLAAQSADVGAQARSGYDTCNEHDGEGGQGFQGGVVVDHGSGSFWGLKNVGQRALWIESVRVQIGSQLLVKLGLHVLWADDAHVGQPRAHCRPNLVGVCNLA